MSNLTFDNLAWLNLLWVVLAVALLGVYGVWQRRRALARFADVPLLPRLTARNGWLRPLVRLGLVSATLTALVAALLGPRWGESEQRLLRRNIDVLMLLDVSRSMLARDIAPNRLERAKLAIRDDLLPALGGDRIGLIAFAGKPSVVCPLTTDYGFFRLALADVTTQSAPVGGTAIGDAIRKAGELFQKELDTHKLVILITDGEDQQPSYPVEAAAALWQEQRVPVIALALGDPEQGARIPVAEKGGTTFLQHGGAEVWSKADFGALERVAKVSSAGRFIAVGTSNFDLGEIYSRVARLIRAEEEAVAHAQRQPSQYHPFAVLALVLLLIDSLLRETPRAPALALAAAPPTSVRTATDAAAQNPSRQARGPSARSARAGRAASGTALLLALLLHGAATTRAQSVHDLIARGNEQYAAGQYAEALRLYEQAASRAPDTNVAELLHNQAAAQFKLGDLDAARELWTRAKALGDPAFEARTRYNLGNCEYESALRAAPQEPQASLAKLAAAETLYRQALRLDPALTDARANLELAHGLRKQIEQQLEQSPQSQPSTQPPDPNDRDPNEPRDPNQPPPDPNQPQDPNKPRDPNQPPDPNEAPDPNPSQEPNQPPDPNQPDPNSPQDPNESSPPQDSNQAEQDPNQSEAGDPENGGEPDEPNRPPAEAGEPNEPNDTGDPNGPPPEMPPAEEVGEPNDPNHPPAPLQLTPAQAERLLQMIRDAEKARREALARQRQSQQRKVERDW